MQGWRSIMHGSPEQSSGKRSAAACSQKSGLDLAWTLNGDCYSHRGVTNALLPLAMPGLATPAMQADSIHVDRHTLQ